MAQTLVLLVTRRSALFLAVLAAILLVSYTTGYSQSYQIDLDDYSGLHTDVPWDTIRAPIDRLFIGPYHSVPNFLPSDFARERVIEEYPPFVHARFTFRLPVTEPFASEETRDGAFIVMTERPVGAPHVAVSVATIDDIAEERRSETLRGVWVASVVRAINAQDAGTEGRRGLLNISIPVPLPGAVEKLIGQGEKTNIDISGRESITFAGETRRISPYYGVEGQQKQPLFPSLDMKQELDVRLQGQIGEKIKIQVDHTSSSSLEGQNRIRWNYQGFDDDVIKLIELGNTSLSLPGSQLVSFSASSKGLFGIKTLAQLGPFDITAIASKEEGEVTRASFSPRGGQIGRTEERRVSDKDFVKNTYYFLDHPPDEDCPYCFFPPKEDSIDVYRSVAPFQVPTTQTTWGAAYVDTLGHGWDLGVGIDFEKRRFRLLQRGDDYRFVLDAETQGVIGIELVQPLSDDEVLAVAYVNSLGEKIGDLNAPFTEDQNKPLLLELIRPANPVPAPPFGYTWAYMIRNIYNLGLSNIDLETFELEIAEIANRANPTTPESSAVPWIRIFGLDQTDLAGAQEPDNIVDRRRPGLIDEFRGLLTFPSLTPFDPDSADVYEWTKGEFEFTGQYEDIKNPGLYTKQPTDPTFQPRFTIVVKAASTTRTFKIDAFNITEGSEVVRIDDRTLQRDRDYKIDYETGEVELLGDAGLTPSSNITIDYEFKPFAGGTSSSLLGMNTIWNLSGNSRLATTWLYESKASPTGRSRLGEEPTRAVAGGLDGNLQFEPHFLTSLVNLLPLVNTDARSSFGLNGGIAVSLPDPNTRGEAYIDDMEGVEDSDVFSLLRRSWYPASPPVDPDDGNSTLPADKRAKVYWYNIEPDRGVHRRDLNPDLDERESTLVPSLEIEFDAIPEDSSVWGGVMAGFRGGLDLSQGQFLELWVNDFQTAPSKRKGILHIDLGYIDEDFYEPDANEDNIEDVDGDVFTIGGDRNEDTGLDGILTGQPGDDPDDDYNSQRIASAGNRFTRINGTEGNGLPDSEDLDGSIKVDRRNAYFSFTVDLSDSAVTDIRRDFPGFSDFTDSLDTWRLYRINLSDYAEVRKDGIPVIEQIRHVRIWLRNVGETVSQRRSRLQVAEFKVVGNRWEKDGIRSALNDVPVTSLIPLWDPKPSVALGVISNKNDPARYVPPVRPNVENEISEKEQSLLVKYDNIPYGVGFRILKRFAGDGIDLSTTYRDLNFFVHTDKLDPDLEYFFRLAYDSLSFYEVSLPFTPEFFSGDNWARVLISLNSLTELKFLPTDSVVTGTTRDLADPDRVYNIRMVGKPGKPSLFNVRYLYAGLRNNSPRAVSGELWINDIYLGNRRRDVDFAQRLTASINMGNVITLSGAWQRTGPEYVPFGQKRGSGADNRAISLSGKTNVESFVPLFGFSIPIAGSYSLTTYLPKYMPNSDTELTSKVIQDSMKSETSSRGFSTSLTRSGSRNPLLKYTFDKLRANYAMSQSRQKSPSDADTSTTMSGTLDYSISFSGKYRLRLFKNFGISYWPKSLNYRVSATRSEGRHYRNVGGVLNPDPARWAAGLSTSGSIAWVPVPSLTSSFRIQTQRDLRLPHEWLGVDVGTELSRSHSFQANYKPPPIWLIRVFSPDLNYNTSYQETATPNPEKPGSVYGLWNVAANRDIGVKLGFDLGRYLGKAFGKVGLVDEGSGNERGPRSRPGPETRDGGAGEPGQGEPPRSQDSTTTGEGGLPAAADSTRAKPKVDPLLAARKLADILSSVQRINASVQQGVRTSYSRIPAYPSLAYQFGLTSSSGIVFGDETYDEPEQIAEDLRILMNSGIELTRTIDVQGRFRRATGSATFRASETRSKAITWPDLSVSWKELEKFGPFRGLFASSSATISYTKSKNESARGGVTETTKETTSLTPSISFQWKNDIRTNVGVQYGKTIVGTRGATTENSNLSVSADLKYTFTPGKTLKIPLPFLRNRTLKSRLETSLSTNYSRAGGRRSAGQPGRFVSVPGTTLIRISPRLAYNFTSALNGSFFIDYSRTHADVSDQTTTLVRVGLTATFVF